MKLEPFNFTYRYIDDVKVFQKCYSYIFFINITAKKEVRHIAYTVTHFAYSLSSSYLPASINS
jgi:hypothetical protein